MREHPQIGDNPNRLIADKVFDCAASTHRMRISLRVLALLLVGGLSACSLAPVQTDSPVTWSSERRANGVAPSVGEEIAAIALKMKGVPYVYGGMTPTGFDCSGLVHYAYAQAGVSIPRTSRGQLAAATRISPERAQPGDLLFFSQDNTSHVAIYIGRGTFIHAPAPGWTVSTASLNNSYYRNKLVAAGRLTTS